MPFGLGFFATAGVSAAGGTYELISSTILTGSQASVTFSNLGDYASTYQHLQIRAVMRSNADGTFTGSPGVRFNGIGSAQYSSHNLSGTGSSVESNAFTSQDYMFSLQIPSSGATSGNFGAYVIDILDPYETSKNTTIRALGGESNSLIRLMSGAWLNTTAVSSVTIDNRDGQSFVQFSRFSLYGIKGA